ALELVRQADVHVEGGDGVLDVARALLDLDRGPDRLDAHLVDGELARVRGGLDVGDVLQVACFHGVDFSIPSKLLGHYVSNRFLDAGGIQAHRSKQATRVSMVDEAVGQTYNKYLFFITNFGQDLAHRRPGAGHGLVLLDGHQKIVSSR